ncbi:MAG: RNB domain-containing ribonuclease [Chloroflexi bacterium]|nr:MAG: RNB domain-containing ribonuclease [Chloroflexota bacterium]
MADDKLRVNSLVLYKNRPARIVEMGAKKITVDVAGNKPISVRPKDVTLLHAGPLASLAQLTPPDGDVMTAWELLEGETTTLSELAELAFDDFTPQTAWAIWVMVIDGLYFSGSSDEIAVHTAEFVKTTQAARNAKAAAEEAWQAFLDRVARGEILAEDGRFLQHTVALAHRQQKQSKLLQALKQNESEENAHKLLLRLGYWDEWHNPYPQRAGINSSQPSAKLPDLPDEERRDLTHLPAYAIDDKGSTDPDDAISWDNASTERSRSGRFWVHIADVAAIVPPDSPADLEARGRGANLYLPEGTIGMLPEATTAVLALGLSEVSPALSIGMTLNESGEITDTEITPSWVRVTRTTYDDAVAMLDKSPLREMASVAKLFETRRRENGSVNIDLPEVRVRVKDEQIVVRPIPNLPSRDLVRDAMLMAGEAVARFAFENQIPLPYTTQDASSEPLPEASTLSEFFALRRKMSPSRQSSTPGAHFGLGMGMYAQATSPLRRYLDLVVHQQLRAYLRGEALLNEQEVMTRVGAAMAVSGDVRWAERQSVRHWTLVHVMQQPDRVWDGVVVDRRGKRDIVLVPELALETAVFSQGSLSLDDVVQIKLRDVNLPQLESRFELNSK